MIAKRKKTTDRPARPPREQLWTADQVAWYLQVHPSELPQLLGELAIKVRPSKGRSSWSDLRFRRSEIEAWLDGNRAVQGAA